MGLGSPGITVREGSTRNLQPADTKLDINMRTLQIAVFALFLGLPILAILLGPAAQIGAQEEPPPPSNTGTKPVPSNNHGKPPDPQPSGNYKGPDGLVEPSRPIPGTPPVVEPDPTTPAPTPAPKPAPTPVPSPPNLPTGSPVTGATSIPRAPTTGTTRSPRIGPASARSRGRTGIVSLENWETWWMYNRDAFIIRRKYRGDQDSHSRNTGIFLGTRTVKDSSDMAPTRWNAIRNQTAPILVRALKDRNPTVRANACIALGKIGRADHVPALVDGMRDTVKMVREAAVLGLGLLGREEAVPALLSVLKADDTGIKLRGGKTPENQLRAVSALSLGLIGKDQNGAVKDALVRLSGHRTANRDMTLMATLGLGILQGNPEYVEEISWHLKNLASRRGTFNAWVRAHAVTGIGRILNTNGLGPDARSLTGLARLMKRDRVSHVRRSAVSALGVLIRDRDLHAAAARVLATQRDRGRGSHTRNLAAIALGLVGGDTAYRSLCEGVKKSGWVTHQAYCALGLGLLIRSVEDRALPRKSYDLSRGLKCLRTAFDREKNLSLRSCLALSLGLARDRESGPRIHKAFQRTREQEFRGYCALALGMVNHEAAVPDLVQIVTASQYSPRVKERAALGLAILGPGNLMPLLNSLKKSRSAYSLAAVTLAVGLAGDHTAAAPLSDLASDRRALSMTRAAACKALGLLGDPRPVPALASLRAHHNYLAASEAVNSILLQ